MNNVYGLGLIIGNTTVHKAINNLSSGNMTYCVSIDKDLKPLVLFHKSFSSKQIFPRAQDLLKHNVIFSKT